MAAAHYTKSRAILRAMALIPALSLLLLLADADDAGWELSTKTEGVSVYSRERKGTGVHEMKATALMDGPPQQIWGAIRDYPHYTQTMPYTEEAKIVSSEQDGKILYFYSVLNLPLVDRRDYLIRIADESDWQDGKGFLKCTWAVSPQGAPPARKGIVRINVNEGYWLLEPREGGAKTFATYYVFTDPGGSLPKWIVNRANATAVPDVFKSIRKVVAGAKK
jgi:hypothetical protein